jgi:hypothetical protein
MPPRSQFLAPEGQRMTVPFLLFVMSVLLVSIFWELTKINNRLKTLLAQTKQDHNWAKKDAA